MRYADGGGLSPAGRRRRETARMQAASLFEQEIKPPEVARQLRVSVKSAYRWRQLWWDGVSGRPTEATSALRTKPGSPVGRPKDVPGAGGPYSGRDHQRTPPRRTVPPDSD
ncbi:helix-turn-helix domain-containing protein, partial [Streptomyces populi]